MSTYRTINVRRQSARKAGDTLKNLPWTRQVQLREILESYERSVKSLHAPPNGCLQLPRQLRHQLEQVADEPDVRDLEDRGVLVLVDRDDHLGFLHPR